MGKIRKGAEAGSLLGTARSRPTTKISRRSSAMAETWSNSIAIEWGESHSGCHWDVGYLNESFVEHVNDCGIAKSTISYKALRELTVGRLVHQLQQLIPAESGAVRVVVAVPEGPLLPMSVLAVHLLNHPSNGSHAVLIPIEPGDGRERIKLMITECKPRLILHLPGEDATKLSSIIDSIGRSISKPVMVNVLSLMQGEDSDTSKNAIFSCADHFWRPCMRQDKGEDSNSDLNRVSHIVFTSGSSGVPKACVSSYKSLRNYLRAKNEAHGIGTTSTVLLASALSFDPCLSDILATFQTGATLRIAPRKTLVHNLASTLDGVTHVLCTPTLWSTLYGYRADDFPSLQLVALGGEPIPKRLLQQFARATSTESGIKVCATYGVTEACVYQTMGEVFRNDEAKGQNVGLPFQGIGYRICKEDDDNLVNVEGSEGEVVLFGSQLDAFSTYLNRDELTKARFRFQNGCYLYRTGDRGYSKKRSNELCIVGRISGQDGMVKVNGVRIELGEVENSLIDPTIDADMPSLVVDSIVVARLSDPNDEDSPKQLNAYCILSDASCKEMGIDWGSARSGGVLVSDGPLALIFRLRCRQRCRVMPSCFILIERTPLSPTGKCDKSQLPELSKCTSLRMLQSDGRHNGPLLSNYGKAGKMVSDVIIDCLNLQPCQQAMVTATSSFAILGGDSLGATRVARTLFAAHHGVENSRFLGGSFGSLDGPFSALHLLRSHTLGDYVDWLDRNNVCNSSSCARDKPSSDVPVEDNGGRNGSMERTKGQENGEQIDELWRGYEALLEAIMLERSTVANGLLDSGIDPNAGAHGGRLSKVSSRLERKKKFMSNPLHLACSRGMPSVVRNLLNKGCKFNAPDAGGSFPIHLASSTIGGSEIDGALRAEEDRNRLACVELLLQAGAPITMKDGNKQTVLHCAARAGHCQLLRFLLEKWKEGLEGGTIRHVDAKNGEISFDWTDRWFRTPVHWAVLNGKADALEILLGAGCSPNPPKPTARRVNRQTSVAQESPIEICQRLYSGTTEVGARMRALLQPHDPNRPDLS